MENQLTSRLNVLLGKSLKRRVSWNRRLYVKESIENTVIWQVYWGCVDLVEAEIRGE